MKAHSNGLVVISVLVAFLVMSGVAGAAVFELDSFKVTKNPNGPVTWTYVDEFNDGVFASTNSIIGYTSIDNNNLGPENVGDNSLLQIDTAQGILLNATSTGNSILRQRAMLKTNTDDSDMLKGFKSDDNLQVQGLYNLTLPKNIGDGYGITLGDIDIGYKSSDVIDLRLFHDANDDIAVQFYFTDLTGPKRSLLESFSLTGAEDLDLCDYDQILFNLSTAANVDTVSASFSLLSGGSVMYTHLFTETARIFYGEEWTRAGFSAVSAAPVPEPATMLLLGTGLIGLAGASRRKRFKK